MLFLAGVEGELLFPLDDFNASGSLCLLIMLPELIEGIEGNGPNAGAPRGLVGWLLGKADTEIKS